LNARDTAWIALALALAAVGGGSARAEDARAGLEKPAELTVTLVRWPYT
jgi:hypothetical protein